MANYGTEKTRVLPFFSILVASQYLRRQTTGQRKLGLSCLFIFILLADRGNAVGDTGSTHGLAVRQ